MLQLGISSWFGYELPLEKRLDLIKQAGFSATCLWMGIEEPLVREGKADLMPEWARERGLFLDNVHASFRQCNHLWSESAEDRKKVRQEYETSLLFCQKHGIPNVVMHVSQSLSPPPPIQSGIQVICGLVSQAEDTGVTIALENTLRPDYLDFIFSRVQSPNLGFCYDSSHDFLEGQSKGAILKKWGSLLKATHISDARGKSDDHLPIGEGTIDWKSLLDSFPDNYQGTFLLEVEKHAASVTPEQFLKSAWEKARELVE
jgi:sugar phosphate isomerase/epimerase